MKKKLYKIVIALSAIVMVGILIYDVLLISEKSPIQYTNQPFPTSEDKVYIPGDILRLIVTRCVSRPIEYSITQSFVNDDPNALVKVYYLESQNIVIDQPGCQTVLGIPKIIPKSLPSGYYHVEHGVSTRGRFRDFIFTIKSRQFRVENDSPTPLFDSSVLPYNTTTQTKQTNTTIQVPLISSTPGTTTVIKETNTKETTTTNNNSVKETGEKESKKEDGGTVPTVIDRIDLIIDSVF